MELRHLRYFVAVAEAGSLTVAAEQRLHTSQPSLSRQIRDLEGDREQFLSFLANALEDPEAELVWIGVDPRFDSIHNEKKFKTTVKTVFPGLTSNGNNLSLGATR